LGKGGNGSEFGGAAPATMRLPRSILAKKKDIGHGKAGFDNGWGRWDWARYGEWICG